MRRLLLATVLLVAVLPGPSAGAADARFHGSLGAVPLNAPIVGMAATPTGGGYWLVASDGGVFTFGDAEFFGSAGTTGVRDVVGMARTPSGAGYWIATRTGRVLGYGEATDHSVSVTRSEHPHNIVAIVRAPSGIGYWLIDADGHTFG